VVVEAVVTTSVLAAVAAVLLIATPQLWQVQTTWLPWVLGEAGDI
jgi:hypothetical protein